MMASKTIPRKRSNELQLPAADHTLAERALFGKSLRREVPRAAHAEWSAPPDRRDPVEILIEQGKSRIQSLLPIRYARMRTDPFAFLRGGAAIMSADLACTPSTGYRVQSCGDAHLANFGAYAAPAGLPVFDVSDFDETLPAPFEWDIKRLATSIVVAAHVGHHSAKASRLLACDAVRAYRAHMATLAPLPPIDAWSQRIDLAKVISRIDKPKVRNAIEGNLARALDSASAHFGLIELGPNGPRIIEKKPLIHRLDEHELPTRDAFASYAQSLSEDRRALLGRYALRDVAFKTVGVGSVGTFCAIGLMVAGDGSPLLLQIKEAKASVLAPFAGASAYANHGQRVVVGQRTMQAATDTLLGWIGEPIGDRYFYVRRLKDARLADIGMRLETMLPFYADVCGRTLARAHARAGDAALILGYLGKSSAFDEAVGDFAVAYANQTENDWQAFETAIRSGRIVAATQ